MDDRLTLIEQEKQKALQDSNNLYSNLQEQNQNLYNQQKEYANEQERLQNEALDKQLSFREGQIEKQKETARENKQQEGIKAKNDYTGYTNQYGLEAENLASRGLLNSGVSETMKLGAYNSYQNRLANANKTMQDAITEYDNSMNEARVNYDTKKAENAFEKLKLMLSYAKSYYDTNATLGQNQLQNNQNLNSEYNNQYNTIRNQLQNEKELEERIRQYNEDTAYQREKDAKDLEYQRERDRIADEQWQKEYNLTRYKAYNNSSNNSYTLTGEDNNLDAFGNNVQTQGMGNYYFKKADGSYTDQPSYINNVRLQTNGVTAKQIGVVTDGIGKGYRIWTDGNKYYVWNNNAKTYLDVTNYYEKYKK
jgi:hypothetical protein